MAVASPPSAEPGGPPGSVPAERVRTLVDLPAEPRAGCVLYWMVAYRRSGWNFALQRALDWCTQLGKPLVVLEALRCDYPWACDRFHAYVVQGMADNAASFSRSGVTYYPYLEPAPGAGSGLLERLAQDAAVVVSDDWPAFFIPALQRAAARRVARRFEVVDSNGLMPVHAAGREFARAFDFRRFLQKELPPHLTRLPEADPLATRALPAALGIDPTIQRRWPATDVQSLADNPSGLASLPIDHAVRPAPERGGERAGKKALEGFVSRRLARYGDERGDPDSDASSGLSAYLHWGHLSAHQAFAAVCASEAWAPDRLRRSTSGSREGWWGMTPAAESFLDELITWRELGFNMCSQRRDYDRFESLPNWAQRTLDAHAADPRSHVYSLEDFERARTHDPLWNAAQRQLVAEGRIHNYLRMLWGKKVLEWSATPRQAAQVLIELNNKYALDGRDPNSYSGIFWVLGRYDRAWGPERPVYGTIRYMSSDNTARKVRLKGYLKRFEPPQPQGLFPD